MSEAQENDTVIVPGNHYRALLADHRRLVAAEAERDALRAKLEGGTNSWIDEESFIAGWEACDRKWEGPSAAGYPTNVEDAWELFTMEPAIRHSSVQQS